VSRISRNLGVVLLATALWAAALGAGAAPAFAAAAPRVNVRIEGATRTVWTGAVTAGTYKMVDSTGDTHTLTRKALCTVEAAARVVGFSYVLKWFSAGGFIDAIGPDASDPDPPYPGWMYRVSGVSPTVGADQFAIKNGDSVLWYYGTWDASPTVAVAPATAAVGTTLTVRARQLDPTGVASPLPGATVHVGSRVGTSDEAGIVRMLMPDVGTFGIQVEKAGGYVRSAVRQVKVGRTSSFAGFTASRSRVRRSGAFALTGRLMSRGKGLVGRLFQIQRRYPSGAWRFERQARTGRLGRFRVVIYPSRTAAYRGVWSGDASTIGATSKPKTVKVAR
jgi:hypothetical protein